MRARKVQAHDTRVPLPPTSLPRASPPPVEPPAGGGASCGGAGDPWGPDLAASGRGRKGMMGRQEARRGAARGLGGGGARQRTSPEGFAPVDGSTALRAYSRGFSLKY